MGVSRHSLKQALGRLGLPAPSTYLASYRGGFDVGRLPPVDPLPSFDVDVDLTELEPPGLGHTEPSPAPRPAQTGAVTRIAVVSDLHAPYHDALAWATCLHAIEALRPDVVVVIGDFPDCYSVSRHMKDPGRVQGFRDEIEAVRRELRRIETLRVPRRIYIEGNHEFRLARYIAAQAPEFYGLLDVRGLLGLDAHGWEWVPYRQHIVIGDAIFTHDVERAGIYAARHSLADAGGSIVFGHSHRLALHMGGTLAGAVHYALNVGHMADLASIDYRSQIRARRDWQTGFGWITQDSTGQSWPVAVPIVEGRCVVDGQLISGRGRR